MRSPPDAPSTTFDNNSFAAWPQFSWVTLVEGFYELRVRLRLLPSQQEAEATIVFLVAPRVSNSPAVVATHHPLIALYSAPACQSGQIWVRFRLAGGAFWQYTLPKICEFKSLNFYVAGMRPNSDYQVQQLHLDGADFTTGPVLIHRTGVPELAFPLFAAIDPPDARTNLSEPFLLMTNVSNGEDVVLPFARDLAGNVVWYLDIPLRRDQTGNITRPLLGGSFLHFMNTAFKGQVLAESDLAGNIFRETNTLAVNQQLVAMGHDPIGSFHHDAVRLASGHTLVIASVERILIDVQGPGP